MSISCECPKCGRVCGFKDDCAGRRARCLHCNTRFIIPHNDNEPPVELPDVEPEGPLPGFYQAVFKDSWKIFTQPESITGIVLCIALTCFHFVIGDKDYSFDVPGLRIQGQIGWVITVITAGYLLWYFIEIINITAIDCDFLPEIDVGDGFAFAWAAVKSIYFFVAAFAIAAVPAAIILNLLTVIGISFAWLDGAIVIAAMLMVPMILSMLACGIAPWMLFRYDRIVMIIIKTYRPYLTTSAVTLVSFLLIFLTVGYFAGESRDNPPRAIMITARLLAVFVTIFAMRTIGLYVRHYYECFPELKVPDY